MAQTDHIDTFVTIGGVRRLTNVSCQYWSRITVIMPTTIKQALKKWEEATGKKAAEATEVKLIGVYPPIEKVEL